MCSGKIAEKVVTDVNLGSPECAKEKGYDGEQQPERETADEERGH
jgi:hypothetical protein